MFRDQLLIFSKLTMGTGETILLFYQMHGLITTFLSDHSLGLPLSLGRLISHKYKRKATPFINFCRCLYCEAAEKWSGKKNIAKCLVAKRQPEEMGLSRPCFFFLMFFPLVPLIFSAIFYWNRLNFCRVH